MKKISIVSSCYNEEENIEELYSRLLVQFDKLKDKYEFECIFLDNASTDNTEQKLRELAGKDKKVKVILNSKNFGAEASPLFGIANSSGDAVIAMASDLQDPPELIPELIQKWEEGNQIVFLRRRSSKENILMSCIRRLYYIFLNKISDSNVEMVINCTGAGLIDKKIVEEIRNIDDSEPYFRGLLSEIGFKRDYVDFDQQPRLKGKSCYDFYNYYSTAMLGITKYSKKPLSFMVFTGFIMSIITFLVTIFYLVWKLLNWQAFSLGTAPIILSILFLGSVQLFFLGIIGEYIGTIYSRVNKKPLVIVKEKINF